MNSEEQLYLDALDVSPDDRERWLRESCADEALRERVLALLAHHDAAGDRFLNGPEDDGLPESIGPFRIVERLGQGGMGTVYLAEQEQPIRRRVALKVVRPALGSGEVLRRFQSERRALALMEHPHIARVLEAGATDDGSPYFVMEYVDGLPITEFCAAEDIDLDGRVRLIIDVCSAVQHAHQKGVVHRDVKPTNVLVTSRDGAPIAKVIDFGIARSVEPIGLETSLTIQGQLVGTPAYMSPEQVDSGGDVDTRSDIYSLGVLLYELTTGTRPYSRDLNQLRLDEVVRAIRVEEPPRPSTRVHGPAASRLRGELEWILRRALEKDRDRRYPSAAALGDDLARFLAGEAVSAGPPTAGYRLRKFAARHRASVAVTALVLALLIVGIATTSWQAIRATAAEAEAIAATRAEEQRRLEAERAQRLAEAANRFIMQVLQSADPMRNPRDATVADALERAAATVDEQYRDDAAVSAEILAMVGRTYNSLGMREEAIATLRRSVERYRELDEPPQPKLAHALNVLAVALRQQGQLTEAERYYRESLAINRELGDQSNIATVTNNLARLVLVRGDLEEAEALSNESLDLHRELWPDDDQRMAMSCAGHGRLLARLGRTAEAEELLREAVDRMRRAHPDGHPFVAVTLDELGNLLYTLGRNDEAIPLFGEAAKIAAERLEPDHPSVIEHRRHLALALLRDGRSAAAERMASDILELAVGRFGEDHPLIPGINLVRALALLAEERTGPAEATARLAARQFRATRPASDPEHFTAGRVIALCLIAQSRFDEAEPLLLAPFADPNPERIPPVIRAEVASSLAKLYSAQGRTDEAERWQARARAIDPALAK